MGAYGWPIPLYAYIVAYAGKIPPAVYLQHKLHTVCVNRPLINEFSGSEKFGFKY